MLVARLLRGILAGLVGSIALGVALLGMKGAVEERKAGEALLKAAVGKGCLKMALFFDHKGRDETSRPLVDHAEKLLTEAVRVGRGVPEWAALLFSARVLQERIGAAKEALRSTVIYLPPEEGLRKLQEAVEMGNLEGVQMAGRRLALDEWERLLVVGMATKACHPEESWATVVESSVSQAAESVSGEVKSLFCLLGAIGAFLLFGLGAYIHPAIKGKLRGRGKIKAEVCGPFEGLELLGWWLAVMLFFQTTAMFVAYSIGRGLGTFPVSLKAWALLTAQVTILIAVIGTIWLQAALKGAGSLGQALKEAGLGPKIRPHRGLFAYSLILPAYAVSVGLTYLMLKGKAVSWNPLLQLVIMAEGPADLIPLVVFLCAAVPFVEELVFRGWLFRGLRASFPFWLAALFSALAFAFIHFDFPLLLPLLAIGWALAFAREVTGSLWATVVAHGLHNAVTVTALRLLTG